ncbi:carbohydrate ABC transporter permease [Marinicrinis sediminis]|uniref:Maltose/maltodextrin transport system permease protein n=1 Tax=Marinicrinis sediminis TaxID=1652465 RepID=A0ABW5R8T9_9BACL
MNLREGLVRKMGNHTRTATILSAVFMGLGQLYNRQIGKALIFLTAEIVGIYLLVTRLFSDLQGLITLGTTGQGFEKVNGRFVKTDGDHSVFLMIFGLIALLVIILLVLAYIFNIYDARNTGKMRDKGYPSRNFLQSIKHSFTHNFPYVLLFLPAIGVLFFTIMPIIFMILMAFTNYSAPDHIPPKGLVDWVGFDTFKDLLTLKQWSKTFFGVLTWTLIWAVLATVTTYFGGILVAMLIQQPGIRYKTLWRTIYIIPYAIPQFISLLIFRNMLNYQFGPINQYLRWFGLDGIQWLNDPTWAKATVIFVNMWIGIPVSMILVIGLLGNIPKDLYEAADVDGASSFQKFKNITMPYILFATAPILIMQFSGNINNFNVIYLLTNGDPKTGDYYLAGTTDLLVTWLYKLALDNQKYSFASAIGILIFIIIASLSIYNFRQTKSFKEEDMVQ